MDRLRVSAPARSSSGSQSALHVRPFLLQCFWEWLTQQVFIARNRPRIRSSFRVWALGLGLSFGFAPGFSDFAWDFSSVLRNGPDTLHWRRGKKPVCALASELLGGTSDCPACRYFGRRAGVAFRNGCQYHRHAFDFLA